MSKRTMLALAAAGLVALTGAALAAPAVAREIAPAAGAITSGKTTHMATAAITPAVPFKGAAQTFKTAPDGKSVSVQSKAGEWFTLTFAKECKALAGAKTVKLSQGAKSAAGRLYVGRRHCKVVSFARAAAVEGAAVTPATPVQH